MSTNANAVRGLAPSGNPPTVTIDAHNGSVPLAAALCFAATSGEVYAVADAAALAKSTAQMNDGSAVNDLCRIAAENRLLCLTATQSADDAVPGTDAASVATSGRERLAALAAAAAGADPDLVARHGPQAAFARTRAAVARGVASARGLAVATHDAHEAVVRCTEIGKERFAALTQGDPEAVAMYRGGKWPRFDRRGFRETNADVVRAWLAAQLDQVSDRYDSPIPPPRAPDGRIDIRLRNWPLCAVGTKALTEFADLQTAEDLGHLIGAPGPDGRVNGTALDGAGYRRFVERAQLPRCFRARDGCSLVRVDLSGLTRAVLAARARLSHVPPVPVPGVAVEPASAEGVLRLLAAGASDATVAERAAWDAGTPLTHGAAGDLGRNLWSTVSGLAQHLEDPWPGLVAEYLGTSAAQLHARVAAGAGASFLRRFASSGVASAVGEPSLRQADREAYRGLGPQGKLGPADEVAVRVVCRWWLPHFRAPIRRLTGERATAHAPSDRCGAVECDAGDAVGAAAFAVLGAGAWPVAWTPNELIVEVPKGIEPGNVAERVASGLNAVLGACGDTPPCGPIERW